MKIPVNEPLLGEEELANVTETLRTGWISSSGRFIEAFESAWAEYCGMDYAVAVSNGTVACPAASARFSISSNSSKSMLISPPRAHR